MSMVCKIFKILCYLILCMCTVQSKFYSGDDPDWSLWTRCYSNWHSDFDLYIHNRTKTGLQNWIIDYPFLITILD